MTLAVGSLFSGIGGLELGLERAGMRVVWQVEKDPFCQRVLAKHWPDVRRHDDVTTFPPGDGADWGCDLICGGFPCQDISPGNAGKQQGIAGKRSGLWREFARIVGLLRPRYVLVENSSEISLFEGSHESLATLRSSGLMRSGKLYPLAPLERRTFADGRSLFATPTVADSRPRWHTLRRTKNGRSLAQDVGGVPRPEFVEWLMGFPTGWTDSGPSETP